MFPLEDFNLETAKIAQAYCKILDFHACGKGMKLLEAIEMYKILTREELVYRLNDLVKEKEDYVYIVTEDRVYTTENVGMTLSERVYRAEDFAELEFTREETKIALSEDLVKIVERFDVVIEPNGDKLFVYYPMNASFDMRDINIALSSFFFKLIPITPRNFRELVGEQHPPRDALLLMRRLVLQCMQRGGSDFKLDVVWKDREPITRVRFRVDETVIDDYLFDDISVSEEETMIKQLIQNHSTTSVAEIDSNACEGFISNIICDAKIESRFGVTKLMTGYFINIRIQALTSVNMTVDSLGLDFATVEVLEYAQQKVQGITWITGPMKSGKTTTLWGMMGTMLKKSISCIEYSSPIEAKMPLPQIDYHGNVVQLRQLLSVAKKQDINVAFLNEIPNKEIAQGVRDLANSNVHVITTFHIDRVWDLPHKLVEYYGSSFKDVMSQVNVVVNQKMYVKQCPHCLFEKLSADLPPMLGNFLIKHGVTTVMDNKGCSQCNDGELIGGRIPKAEWLFFDDELIESLRGLNEPRDMEKYLKELVLHNETYKGKNVALEYKLLESIKSGELSYKALYTLKTLGGI